MTGQIIITSRCVLEAAKPFVREDENRQSISGIRFDGGLMIATDGTTMAVIKPRLWWSDCDAAYTVKYETIENVLSVRPLYSAARVFVIARITDAQSTIEVRECILSIPNCSYLIPNKIAEGHSILEYVNKTSEWLAMFPLELQEVDFPNWKRAIPPIDKFKSAPRPCGFTTGLLARLSSLSEKGGFIQGDPSLPAVFLADTKGQAFDAFALVMPETKPVEIEYPLWLNDAVFPSDNGSTQPVNHDSNS